VTGSFSYDFLSHQPNDAPIPKHLAEASLLIRTYDGGRLEIDIKICVDSIVAKVVFLEHRVFQFITPLFNVLYKATSETRRAEIAERQGLRQFWRHLFQTRAHSRRLHQSRLKTVQSIKVVIQSFYE
jgi:hypothetical protein